MQGRCPELRPFRIVRSTITPLDKINVDTDQIVPKQFLKLVQRSGFGRYLFYDWRYEVGAEGGGGGGAVATPRAGFVLNDPRYAGSSILVTGKNFGCGSSREHAVWALEDHGFRVIIAPSFADIFYSNCLKNGVLPVTLGEDQVRRIMGFEGEVEVDLEKMRIVLQSAKGDGSTSGAQGHATIPFEIDMHKRTTLLEGLDEIAQTLRHKSAISEYERTADCTAGAAPPI